MSAADGLRVRLTPIKGVTKGKTKEYLTPEFRFQCPPLDGFSHGHGHNHVRGQNYRGEESIRRSGRKLVTIPMRTLIVEYASFAVADRWDLQYMLYAFKAISQEGWPFRLMATHLYNGAPEVDRPVVLEDVTITEQANEPDARYLDLTFTEKDDPEVTRKTNRRSGAAKDWPFTIQLRKDGKYSVVGAAAGRFKTRGEPLTLEVIARYAYGAPSLARFVANAQRPKIGDWGVHSPLIGHARFKKGGKIVVPEPPDIKTDRGGAVARKPPVKLAKALR